MKKPTSILAILLVIAIAAAAVFGVQQSNVSNDLTAKTAAYDALTKEMANAKTASDAALADVQAALDAANAELAAAKTENETAAAKIAELEEDLAKRVAHNDKVNAELVLVKHDKATATQKIAELEGAIAEQTAAAETAAAEAAAKIAELETTLAAEKTAAETAAAEAAAKIAELETTLAAEKTAAETAAAEAAAKIAEQEAALTAEKAAAETAAAEAAAKIAELETALAAEKTASETAAAKIAELEAAAETAAAKITELEGTIAEQTAAAAEAAAKIELLETYAITEKDLKSARSYVRTMYKNSPETTLTDYTVVSQVVIGDKIVPIEWTVDHEAVKIIPGALTTIDVDDKNPEEVHYNLTATMTAYDGKTAELTFAHKVPAAMILEGMSYEEIVASAYTLEENLAMPEAQRLFGTVTKIDTEYSEKYGNITVTIQVGDLAEQPIMCYRLKGEGAEKIAVGDEITVEGIIKNYKGTIEFDAGCVLVGFGEIVSQKGILDAAYSLEENLAMTAPTALAGEIVKIDTAYNEQYGNITVTIVCDGQEEQPIMCYRLSGEGAATLAVGDKIGVYGTIKNYKGTIEFDAGCKLVAYEDAAMVRTVLSAYTLEDGLSMPAAKTLTGVIVAIPTAYNPDYKNLTVDIVVAGMEDYKIECYRLSGEGADTLAVGDTITVTGIIKNYKGLIEFDKGCTLDAVVKAE